MLSRLGIKKLRSMSLKAMMRAVGDAVLPRTTEELRESITRRGAGAVVGMTVPATMDVKLEKLKDCSSALSLMLMASAPAVTVFKLQGDDLHQLV
jgi:hypothetical protein